MKDNYTTDDLLKIEITMMVDEFNTLMEGRINRVTETIMRRSIYDLCKRHLEAEARKLQAEIRKTFINETINAEK
jgi:sensor histidine kinase YesM